MKLLHTGDWHIGKLVFNRYMTEDQRYLLKQLVTLVKEEAIDVVLIAGDLYDRQIPPADAVSLLNEIITELTLALGVKVIAIAGNHDSPERLDFGQDLLKNHGFYIEGKLMPACEPIEFYDEYGPVRFYPIPYADPAVVRAVLRDDSIKTHESGMRVIIEQIRQSMDNTIRNICLSHAFVIGDALPETSESERQLSSIGGVAHVPVSLYEAFDYVALGHLHRPQRIVADHIRYAGSLMKYSFSEADHIKSVTVINLGVKGDLDIQLKTLKPLRDMRRIEGPLEMLCHPDVISGANREDYIHVTLTDQGALFEPLKKMRAFYPNILQLERSHLKTEKDGEKLTTHQLKQKKPEALFEAFYQEAVGTSPDKNLMTHFHAAADKAMTSEGGEP
ncbi:exonuclease SbcCD subunit D [Fusibacter paucivorans]|uniref:Nuclease SbcCD subunit D n=1 Tax=Fusibacter paucivorans TaxID=76009 RepID=A0ABS5PQQ4_9FIRM|nr:exonuclease SbcCD subunit D [Fusibacter paucivorans]MBS7527484.1 exonuclease SbcCD subunit D [Fusibacter paucivorans]